MSTGRRSILASLALLGTVGVLTACTAPPAPEPSASQSVAAPSATPDASPEPTTSATAEAEASCESILPADTVADFEEIGWTAQEKPFYAGAVELTEGFQCTWGDYTVATDHVQIFGWAPATDSEAETAQQELLSSGWRGEESENGLYVTESADTAISTDADGYGITYLFGDGWVTIADTKQGLLLIERPQG
ncbi:hypothetical protein ACFXQA_08720 [Microbacterium sp. P07]|uniref:hypothetical protein n=1 Tax=Microbacterium sp. P07 TaxID=3366952 RepID=UPI003745EA02